MDSEIKEIIKKTAINISGDFRDFSHSTATDMLVDNLKKMVFDLKELTKNKRR